MGKLKTRCGRCGNKSLYKYKNGGVRCTSCRAVLRQPLTIPVGRHGLLPAVSKVPRVAMDKSPVLSEDFRRENTRIDTPPMFALHQKGWHGEKRRHKIASRKGVQTKLRKMGKPVYTIGQAKQIIRKSGRSKKSIRMDKARSTSGKNLLSMGDPRTAIWRKHKGGGGLDVIGIDTPVRERPRLLPKAMLRQKGKKKRLHMPMILIPQKKKKE